MNITELEQTRSEGAASPSLRPEFFRLPKCGGDPHFGLGRSYYYEGEKQGYWRLVRIRQRGKVRGVTLVPYDVIAAYIRKQGDGYRAGTPVPAHKAGYARKQACPDNTAAVSKPGQDEGTIGGGR
jgi:hypothetical protein